MIRKSVETCTIALGALAIAGSAAGHPGHGPAADPAGWVHHLGTPEHVLPGLLVALLAGGLLAWRSRRTRTP